MKHCIQTGCLVLGILCFFYYIMIVIYAGLKTSVSWLWLLGGAFFLFLYWSMGYAAAHPQSVLVRVNAFCAALVALALCIGLAMSARIVRAMHHEPQSGLEYVIVLGAQVKGTVPSRALRKRLDRALEYGEANPDTVFILSGGQGPDEGITEAQCMYEYMTANGMAPERLLLEDRSTSTAENLAYSHELYDLKDHPVGILSNNFHIYRALQLAEHADYSAAEGIPADSDIWMQPHNVLREVCCIFLERVKGEI